MMRRVDLHSECLSHRASIADMQRLLGTSDSSSTQAYPVVHHLRGGTDALLIGTISREALIQIYERWRQRDREHVIDFLDPTCWLLEADGHSPAMNRMPLHVAPATEVQDVFL